jgi:hypothetical protein
VAEQLVDPRFEVSDDLAHRDRVLAEVGRAVCPGRGIDIADALAEVLAPETA